MERIIGADDGRLYYEQNAEGMYNIMIKHKGRSYCTGFIYDSFKLLNKYQLRVSQTDSQGRKKYGLIAVCSDEIVLPCEFDIIKPYESWVAQASIENEEYFIDRWGRVYNREFWELHN